MENDPPIRPDEIYSQLQFCLEFNTNALAQPSKIDWWDLAFLPVNHAKIPVLRNTMLYLIAYDITSPTRLRKIAKTCLDFGVRVQYSLFECRLNPDHFEELWQSLTSIIDSNEDRIVSYRLDTENAAKTLTAGTMEITTPVICYLI